MTTFTYKMSEDHGHTLRTVAVGLSREDALSMAFGVASAPDRIGDTYPDRFLVKGTTGSEKSTRWYWIADQD